MPVLYVGMRSSARKERYEALRVGDVAQIFIEGHDNQPFLDAFIGRVRPGWTAVRPVDVVRALHHIVPEGTAIEMMGEQKCMVQGLLPGKRTHPLAYIATVLVALLLFFGGAITLMNFHADVDMPTVHANLSALITGREDVGALWVSIPYSVGIALGVIFFTGFGKKRTDPNFFELEEHEYREKVDKYQQDDQTGDTRE